MSQKTSFEDQFREAVEEENVRWLKVNVWSWWERKDLLDDVIEKSADFTARIIQNIVVQRGVYLLRSLIKEKRE